LNFTPAQGANLQAGLIIKIDRGTNPSIYFKTFHIGSDSGTTRMQIGQEVNAPIAGETVVDGTFADRHSCSHRIKANNTLLLVTTKTDLEFQVK